MKPVKEIFCDCTPENFW